ncbi:MAG: LysR family transcriptional regulator [Rhodospirillaceae bacterium]|nr:LysR family transcriptional regulator [Rhodospirillaceae bacterium]
MDLRQYRYFQIVAEELHFGRAAKRLHISQPSLSLQIQRLERELGTPLLKRTKRRVELTSSGAVLAERAKAVLEVAARAEAEVKRVGRGERDRLTLGYMSAAMLPMFPAALRRFLAVRPEVDIRFEQNGSSAQLRRVVAGEIDLGFVDLARRGAEFVEGDVVMRHEPVTHERLMVGLPPGHPLEGRAILRLAELANDPFVTLLREPATGFYDQIIQLCRGAGFSPRIRHEAPDLPVMLALVASGRGVALVPDCVVPLWPSGIAFRRLAERAWIDVTMIWRKDNASPALAALVEAMRIETAALRKGAETEERPARVVRLPRSA